MKCYLSYSFYCTNPLTCQKSFKNSQTTKIFMVFFDSITVRHPLTLNSKLLFVFVVEKQLLWYKKLVRCMSLMFSPLCLFGMCHVTITDFHIENYKSIHLAAKRLSQKNWVTLVWSVSEVALLTFLHQSWEHRSRATLCRDSASKLRVESGTFKLGIWIIGFQGQIDGMVMIF